MNYVVQININRNQRSASQKYDYSEMAWRKWCDKNGVGYTSIKEDFIPQADPQWYKIFIPRILKESGIEFNQILYVDSDTIVHPDMPNVFDLSENKFCVVRNFGSMDWVCRSVEAYKQLFPDINLSPFEYFNSGFMLFNETHTQLFEKLIEYYFENYTIINTFIDKYHVGRDQPILNYFVKKELIPVKYFPYEFNMQDMTRFEVLTQDLLFSRYGWVYHFNAGVKPSPGEWMEYVYKMLWL